MGNGLYFADFAVVIAFFSSGIVTKKHHLGPHLECQGARGRVIMLGKISGNFSVKTIFFPRQCHKPGVIDGVSSFVVGGQGDIALVVFRDKIFNITLVQVPNGGGPKAVVTDPVEQLDESGVGLTVNMV